jgi:N-acetylglucosaminyl-diphospho-decaprenol L-rhamnosyltransferase
MSAPCDVGVVRAPRIDGMGDGHDGIDDRVASESLTARVAIITVSFGSELVLPKFLDSIPTSTHDAPLVVVVDNKPEPASTIRTDSERRGASYIPAADNPGYGAAVNRAAAGLPPSVEWILISNPDVVLGAHSIDRMLEIASADDRIAAVGPALINSDGTVYPSARAIPSVGHGIGHALFANVWPGNPWTRNYHRTASGAQPGPTGWLSGACLVVRREVFDEVGGFDESYFMYNEDVDLGYRISRSGYLNVYAPDAEALHAGAHSTAADPAPMISAHHRSARRFLAKRYPGIRYIPLRAIVGVGLRLRAFVGVLRGGSSGQRT